MRPPANTVLTQRNTIRQRPNQATLFSYKKIKTMKTILCLLSVFFLIECTAQNCNEANSLLSVRKRKVGSTEYVIFTLIKPATTTIDVADAQPPFIQDGSGQTVHVSGCKFKKVTFTARFGASCLQSEAKNTRCYAYAYVERQPSRLPQCLVLLYQKPSCQVEISRRQREIWHTRSIGRLRRRAFLFQNQ